MAPRTLKTGDLILLKASLEDHTQKAFVSCDGTVGATPTVVGVVDTNNFDDFRDMLFKVVFRCSYNASKDLERARKSGAPQSEIDDLKEKVSLEQQQNKDRCDETHDVKYGDTIQLLHVKSNKFMRVQPRQTAPTERRARAVVLDKGNTHAAFILRPYYKYKYQGEPVLFDQQVLLSAAKLGATWLLHTRGDHLLDGSTDAKSFHELNCSTEVNGFFPVLYARPQEHVLTFCSSIRFFHSQQEKMFGASCTSDEKEQCVTRKPGITPGPKRPFMRRLNESNLDHKLNIWPKGIWLIENINKVVGGEVFWKQKMRLKHVGSGKYLAIDKRAHREGGRLLSQLKPVADDDCVFLFEPVEDPPEPEVDLQRGMVKVMLRYAGHGTPQPMWLSCVEGALKIPGDQSDKQSLEVSFTPKRRIRDTLQLNCLNITEPDFLIEVNNCMGWADVFLDTARKVKNDPKFRKGRKEVINTTDADVIFDMEDQKQTQIRAFDRLAEAASQAIAFMTGQSYPDELPDALECALESILENQRMARALKLIDTSFVCFKELWAGGYSIKKLTGNTEFEIGGKFGIKRKLTTEEMDELLEDNERQALLLIVEFWRASFQNDRENESYFDRNGWVQQINAINGLGLGAAQVLSELTNNNPDIASSIPIETIQAFADFIGQLGPDKTWLVFMKSLCSCQGKALSANQEVICRMMFFPGPLATKEEKEKWGTNRVNYLLSVNIGETIGSFPTLPQHILDGQFIGQTSMINRLCDIIVTWDTIVDKQWQMFKDWIYYHPEHLFLTVKKTDPAKPGMHPRPWVSLADVAWVLSPEMLFALISPDQSVGNSWKEKGDSVKKTGRFGALETLALYFLAQINLIGEMCLDRQINCINSVSEEYNFELVGYAMWNPLLPPQLRGAFCRLFQNLWLNRPPHAELNLPQLVHKYDALSSLPILPAFEYDTSGTTDAASDPYLGLPTKFNLMVAYCCSHFAQLRGRMVYSNKGQCEQIAAAAELINNLIYFGFVSSNTTLCVLINLLIKTLDGRTDWLSLDDDSPEANAGPSQGEGGALDDPMDNDIRAPLLQSEEKSTGCCGGGSGSEANGGTNGGTNGSTNGVSGSAVPLYYKIPADESAGERWSCAGVGTVVESKLQLVKVVQRMVEIVENDDLQTLLSVFFTIYETGKDEFDEGDAKQVLDALAATRYDFNKLGAVNMSSLLIDLMMYEDSDIFSCAITVMWALNHRVEKVVDTAQLMTILVLNEEMKIYEDMKRDVARLWICFNTFDDWGRSTPYSLLDEPVYEEVYAICIRLRMLCSEGGPNIDQELPEAKHQNMLASLGLAKVAMYAYNFDPSLLEDKKVEALLKKLMQLICQLLAQFINDHGENQQVVFDQLDMLQPWLPVGIGVANVVRATFIENIGLCEVCPREIIFSFGRQLTGNLQEGGIGYMPSQLGFFRSIADVSGHPVVVNKVVIVELLKNVAYEGILHIIKPADDQVAKPPEGGLNPARRLKLVRGFKSWDQVMKPTIFQQFKGDDAEIMYHVVSLELLSSLCLGRDKTGAAEFVQFLAPARSLATGFLDITKMHEEPGITQEAKNMSLTIRKSQMMLIETGYYDTELADQAFLGSLIHVQLLEAMCKEMTRSAELMKRGQTSKIIEQFLFQAIRTVNGLLEFTDPKMWAEGVKDLVNKDFLKVFQTLQGPDIKAVNMSNTLFRNSVGRALAWITKDTSMMSVRLVELPTRPTVGEGEMEAKSVRLSLALSNFTTYLLDDSEAVKMQKVIEHEALIAHISSISDTSNPQQTSYSDLKTKLALTGQELPEDYRRTQIKREDLVDRAVQYCLEGDNMSNWDVTTLVIEMTSDSLLYIKDPALLLSIVEKVGSDIEPVDADLFVEEQVRIAERGAVSLMVKVLMKEPETDIINESMQLGILLLEPRNEKVQEIYQNLFYEIDDSGLWAVIEKVYGEVEMNIKTIRGLKELERKSGEEAMTDDEKKVMEGFEEDLKICARVMYLQKLFCEGHNQAMQQYIFRQVDNSVSTNFVEKTVDLLAKMCKNGAASNMVDQIEMDVILQVADLLVELTCGPDARNQEFLSVSGLVELTQKIQQGRFALLRKDNDGDCYPDSVRSCKARLTNCVFSMLELRQNEDVHRNLLFRFDGPTEMNRLIFVHRWFISSQIMTGGAHGDAGAPHICSGEDGFCKLDDPDVDDGVIVPSKDPIILLQDYEEGEVSEMLDEAFNIIMIFRELSEHSSKFKETVLPSKAKFDDDPSHYSNPKAFEEAKKGEMKNQRYAAAWNFFDKWINSIEIVIDGKIFDQHFRIPILCGFVLGKTKEDIKLSIDIETPEDKIADFTDGCSAAYTETEHTLALSKWSPSICKLCMKSPPRPLNFFLKDDSKNLLLMSTEGLRLAGALNCTLLCSLKLVDKLPYPKYASADLMLAVNAQGALYFCMMFAATLVVAVTYSPLDYATIKEASLSNDTHYVQTFMGLALAGGVLGAGIFYGKTALGGIGCYLIISKLVAHSEGGGTHCPNNELSRWIATVEWALGRQDIFRRGFLTFCALLGLLGLPYMYTFLLLDILFLSPMLQNVVKAVTVPIEALTLTAVVGVIVMYEYAIIAFWYFRRDYEGTCNAMIDCTMTTIYQGLRMDIGSALKETHVFDDAWYPRMAFDLSYFVVITTVLMNVIFGIILDQFGQLRDDTSHRFSYFKNTTMIASLDRSAVEEAALAKGINSGWDYLEHPYQGKHHCWKYLNFIFYLRTKDPTEYLGAESIIAVLLEDGEASWMPKQTCKIMVDESAGDESAGSPEGVAKALAALQNIQQEISDKVEDLERELAPAEEEEAE